MTVRCIIVYTRSMKWSIVVVTEELDSAVQRYLAESKLHFSTFIREAVVEYLRKRGYIVEDVHPPAGGKRK